MPVVRLAAALLAGAALLTACGSSGSGPQHSVESATTHASRPKGPAPGQFLSVDAGAHRVTITLIAGYNGTNNGFNFDGYSQYLLWTVPRGWTVQVVCTNRGALRHSCAVVQGAGTTKPAFPGAETPQPGTGLERGSTARFSFRATRTGVYRFVCLVPGHEAARMWDPLKIVAGGRPSVGDLRAP